MKAIYFTACAIGALTAANSARAEESPVGEEIVVTGQRAQQERAIEAKRNALGVVDVASGDEIGRLPDRNVSEVVERLPGVGVTYDQGEGRYVAIRGVPSNLNNYTFSGIEVGNPDGTTRALPLDVIAGNLLNRVEVAKVKTPDMDGQGIGGTINLVPQTAFDYKNRFNVTGSAKAGIQELNDKVPYAADLAIGARFGSDEQFGIVLGGSYSFRDFNSEGFYPDNWRPDARFARGGVPDNIKYTRYSLARERYGVTGSLDWRPSAAQAFYVRGFYSKFTEDEIRPRYRLDFATAALTGTAAVPNPAFILNPDGLTGTVTTGTERREDLRLNYKAKWLSSVMFGGSSEFGTLKLNYEGSHSHNETLDKFPIWQFRCNPGAVTFDFGQKVYEAAPVNECTANQLEFRQYQTSYQLNVEKIWQGKLDATWQLDEHSFLRAGFKYRDTDRSFDQDLATYIRAAAPNRWTLGGSNTGGPGTCVYPDSDNPKQCYFNSPTFNIPALQAFTAANLGGALMPLDATATATASAVSDFGLHERVAAAYVMGNIQLTPAIALTAGVRYEHTALRVNGFEYRNGTIRPVTSDSSYNDFLPSVVVRITPADNTVVRIAYSRSLGRPEYNSLNPGGTVDTIPIVPTASIGNPALKPYRADNLDMTAEWYFTKGGLLSVGVFAKFIRNPIFGQTTTLTNATFNGVLYPTLQLSQPFNAEKGDIVGIEAQFQQQLTFLPGFLSGFGIGVNGTLISSHLRLPDGRTSTFPSQSSYLYGAELFYQKGPLEASVAYHNTGHALLAVGSPAYNDQYNDDLRRLDAKVSVQLTSFARVFFEAQNLTDEPTRQYQGGNPDWLIQNERYGRTFSGGMSFKF